MKDFSPETIALILKKLKNDFPFIRIQGNLLHLSMIMNRVDQVKFSENSLTKLPDGIHIEFSDEILSMKCGGIDDEKGTLSRECFNGYQTNALNYVREQHSDLLLTKKEVGHHFRIFMSGMKWDKVYLSSVKFRKSMELGIIQHHSYAIQERRR